MNLGAGGIALIVLAAIVLGIAKTGLPGVSILAIPMVAASMPARQSTGFILPLLVFGDIIAIAYWHRAAKWRHIVRLLPWTVAGMGIGFLVLKVTSDAVFKPILGALILLIVGADALGHARGRNLPVSKSGTAAAAVGILAGALTMMANAAGPLMTIYLLSIGLPKDEFVGTGAWFYFILNVFKLPFSFALGFITTTSLVAGALLLPLIALGAFLGIVAQKRLPQNTFNLVARILAAAGGVNLLI